MIVLLLSTASAWKFAGDPYSSTYRAVVGRNYRINTDFDSTRRGQIALGASLWDAGPGERIRGATFGFTRGGDVNYSASCNGRNEVRSYNRLQMGIRGGLNANGMMTYCHPVWLLWEAQLTTPAALAVANIDIGLSQNVAWCTQPSVEACLPWVSLAQTSAHEFGHFAGFNHERVLVSTMWASDRRTDIGQQPWISENDVDGLQTKYPGSSTGVDLGVKAWRSDSTEKAWLYDERVTWSHSFGGFGIYRKPRAILATMIGTGSSIAPIRWYVTAGSCDSTPQYTVGTRTPTMSTNVPYEVGPSGGFDLSAVPVGEYRLCVEVDPDDVVVETDETNNRDQSDAGFVRVIP